ncbi:hypothetical protein GCM10010468_57250 [Actinocorallia longicatena]|uniref:AMP-dependent synthetase/ligase domain-containing protein n=1 Tax=Actinocorallia longicatena TaxID=111803 RepID=A0ABP6QHE1_9ACTN
MGAARTVTAVVLGALRGAVLSDGEATLGHTQFAATVRSAAAGLVRRGVRPGDVGGVLAPGVIEHAIAVHALTAAGAVPMPLRPDPPDELGAALAGARVLLVDERHAALAMEAAGYSRVRQIFAFGEVPGTTPFGELVSAIPAQLGGALPVHDRAFRSARGDMTHAQRLAHIAELGLLTGIRTADVVVFCSPLCRPELRIGLTDLALTCGAVLVGSAASDLPVVAEEHRATVAVVGAEELPVLLSAVPRQGVSWVAGHVVVTGDPPEDAVALLGRRGVTVTVLT